MIAPSKPFLTIAIKTLNEEEKIGRAIESALRVAAELDFPVEVLVADSGSTDTTLEIAARYPVRIVQLENLADRGCGIGVELGYQHARGDHVYLLDGDMEIQPGFMRQAFAALDNDPTLAGVGGFVRDTNIANGFDRIRVNNRALVQDGYCPYLEGGGLYRRAAIESAGGHAANRNLKGYEEAELGMRLTTAGWRLRRLPLAAATHTGHPVSSWQLLKRHWRSRRAMAGGVLVRSAIGRKWFPRVCIMLRHSLATGALWCLFVLALVAAAPEYRLSLLLAWLVAWCAVFLALWIKKRDLHHAILSLYSWHYGALATAWGAVLPQAPVASRIPCVVIQDAPPNLSRPS